MFQLREAKTDDIEAIYDLIVQLENKEFDKQEFQEIYCSNLADSNIHYYVCEMENQVVGFISIHIQKLLHHVSAIAEIQELVVHESFRKSGIGRALFHKAKEISMRNQCTQIEVCCNQKRTSSHLFYQEQGMANSHFKFCLSELTTS